jgi:hypothetical protein
MSLTSYRLLALLVLLHRLLALSHRLQVYHRLLARQQLLQELSEPLPELQLPPEQSLQFLLLSDDQQSLPP